jgi:eukaryotic-like serine/threonine-protein kinase
MSIETGQQIGHYRIVSKIGSGGMGEVYLASDTKLERSVAIKFLHEDMSTDADKLSRFVQEAKAASGLNHPNILTIHEIGEHDGLHYIATELIKGQTLRDRMRQGRLTLREAIDVALQVASALNAAHEAGIVHRDIKPENIMIRDDGGVKILDFGLVKLSEKKNEANSSDPTRVKTSPGTVMGTATYMSPEQARGKDTDNRTDIWSLGVVLYEMLAGKTPFIGESTNDTIAAILRSEPEPLGGDTPNDLRRIIRRTLQKQPGERYQTVKDLLLDIRDLKRELEFSEELERSHMPNLSRSSNVSTGQISENPTLFHTGPPSTQTSLAGQPSSSEYLVTEVKKHKYATMALLAAVLLTTAGFGYWFLNRSARPVVGSIAVLPFTSTATDPEFEYVSEGLAEALINNLSRLPNLKVIARSSSFTFKGKEIRPEEAAQKLGVDAIVMGRVRKRGDDVTVSLEMVKAADGTQMWGETYTRSISAMQTLQAEIARTVSEKLRIRLTGDQERLLAKGDTTNPEAYELYQKGSYFSRKGGPANNQKAVAYHEQAVALDPLYANAWAALSIAYGNMARRAASVAERKSLAERQKAAAQKAIEIAPDSDQALNAFGVWKQKDYKWAEAEEAFKRAVEVNPNYGGAVSNLAGVTSYLRRHDEAISLAKRAMELDPLSATIGIGYIRRLVSASRFDDAIAASPQAIELAPENPYIYFNRSQAYLGKKMFSDAIADTQKLCEINKDSIEDRIVLATTYAMSGDRARAESVFNENEPQIDKVPSDTLAAYYAAVGNNQKALALLEKAFADGEFLGSLAVEMTMDPLRTEPRFKDLLRKLNLPE